MVNIGKFAKEVLAERPPAVGVSDAEVAVHRHVVAYVHDKWLRFDTLELARQVVPPREHHRIYLTPDELAFKLGAARLMELGRQFACKSTAELWAKLQMQAYDPLVKYEEMVAAENVARKTRGPRPKRYKKKVAYRFCFDPTCEGHANVYQRLPPQACALVDLLHELTKMPERPEDKRNIFTEEELQGYVMLRRDMLYTKQDPWRIFQYYRGKLISGGFLRFHHEK
ncbi:MAG TPA: hypothetical protein PKD38_07445 [Nitrospira sp.]|nr:hypothetical protein [Nitrospira sp.]